jgi:hypothetical protein
MTKPAMRSRVTTGAGSVNLYRGESNVSALVRELEAVYERGAFPFVPYHS